MAANSCFPQCPLNACRTGERCPCTTRHRDTMNKHDDSNSQSNNSTDKCISAEGGWPNVSSVRSSSNMSSSDAMMSCMSRRLPPPEYAWRSPHVVLEMSQTHFQRVDLLVHVLHRTPTPKLRSWLSCPSCREACAPCAGRNRACCRGDRCRGSSTPSRAWSSKENCRQSADSIRM